MATAEAWVVRDIQRRRIVETLQQKFFKLDDEINPNPWNPEEADAPFLDVAGQFFVELENRRGPFNSPERHRLEWFVKEACAKIDKEARSPEEANVLISMLAQKLLISGLNSFQSNLQRQEMEDPKRIFNAPSAMHEVELPPE